MGRSLQTGTAPVRDFTVIAPLSKGGTNANSVPSAQVSLGAISNNKIGAANGVVKLDADAKIPAINLPKTTVLGVTLKGIDSVAVGQVVSYVISNYDSRTAYTVSVNAGSVSIAADIVTFTAPSTLQSVALTINGRVINIAVTDSKPNKPVLTGVTSGVGVVATLILSSSAFIMNAETGIHKSTDWEVSTTPDFTNILFSSPDDTVNLLSITVTGLSTGTTYYARCRHRDANNGISSYSLVLSLITKASYILNVEIAKLIAYDKNANDNFGGSVSLSADGSRVAVAAYDADPGGVVDAGAVYIYLRTGNIWTLESKLVALDKTIGDRFGVSVSLNSNATRIAIGADLADVTVSNTGAVYVFSRLGTVWTQEAKLVASDKAANDSFGRFVSISSDSTRIAVGAWYADVGAVDTGAVYVFSCSGTTWTQEAKLVASDRAAGDYFGVSVSFSKDASRLAIGSHCSDPGAVSNAGSVYIFTRSGTSWTQEGKLVASDKATNDYFGTEVSLNLNGDRIVIGAYGADAGAVDTGAAYIFSRADTVWTQEAKLVAADGTVGNVFGRFVSINGDATRAVIGSCLSNPSGIVEAGAVYVFVRTGAFWALENKIVASDKATGDRFGYSVSISSDSMFIATGAVSTDVYSSVDVGAAYIFTVG